MIGKYIEKKQISGMHLANEFIIIIIGIIIIIIIIII